MYEPFESTILPISRWYIIDTNEHGRGKKNVRPCLFGFIADVN